MSESRGNPPQAERRPAQSAVAPATQAAAPAHELDTVPDTARQALDTKILRSSGWVALSFGGSQLLSLLSMLILVRLLEPKAFGLVALAWTFLIVAQYVQESGLGAALIFGRRNVEEAAACALVFAPAFALVLFGASYFAAPSLAGAFHESALTDVLRVMSLMLVVRSLAVAPAAILERALDFRSKTAADLGAALAQISVAVVLAFAGWGVWSLVFGHIAFSAVRTVALWLVVPWRPSPRHASWRIFREMVRYGRFVSAAQVVNLLNRTLDNLTIGRLLGATPLGFYAIAFRLATLPGDVVGHIAGRPMFAAYSALQQDLAGFRRAYVQNLQRVTLLAVPLSIGIAVAAEPIVLTVLGEAWTPAVTPLRILALFALVKSLTAPAGAVWQGLGKPHVGLVFQVLHVVMLAPALILFTQHLGLKGAAIGMLVVDVASGVPAVIVTMRLLKLAPIELARGLAPSAACAGLLAAALGSLLPVSSSMSPPAALGILISVAVLVYVTATVAFARSVVVPIWVSLRGTPSA